MNRFKSTASALRRALTIIVVTISTTLSANAQLTASAAFTKAPQNIFPLLDMTARLDMIDYFNSGMVNNTINALNGKSKITAMTPQKLTIKMTDTSTHEINLITTAGNDTIIALISTVATPAPDSRMTLYTKDWTTNITDSRFNKPTLKNWLTATGAQNSAQVEALVPFLIISYSYDPADSTLTLTNNTQHFLSKDVYEIVEPFIKKTLRYKWDGKRFIPEA